jgi:hypothetical protein
MYGELSELSACPQAYLANMSVCMSVRRSVSGSEEFRIRFTRSLQLDGVDGVDPVLGCQLILGDKLVHLVVLLRMVHLEGGGVDLGVTCRCVSERQRVIHEQTRDFYGQ